ncbi:MAG: tetratricopeptide repeat protein [Firmicutes bacterium]|nr:tetratricopeptide repeat protein [Bacillota bacterium]
MTPAAPAVVVSASPGTPPPQKGTEYNPNPSSMGNLPKFKEHFDSPHEESDYYVRHGFDSLNQGKIDEAEKKLKKALKAEPGNFNVHDGMSMLYYESHRFDNSIECCTKAIKIAKDTDMYEQLCPTTVLVRRGACYLNLKKYDDAIKDFDEVIRIKPDFAFVYYDRGRAYFGKGDWDKAEADFNTSLKLDKEQRFKSISEDYLKQIAEKKGKQK